MRIVVTGGAGFIGSAVCKMLVAQRGATVLNLDKLTAASSLASLRSIAQSPRYSFRKVDVSDRERVAALLHAFAPDAIVHAAAERQAGASFGYAQAAIETNVLGTWRMLEAARDYWSGLRPERQAAFRFLSVSSIESQASPAAASRAGADELVAAWHKSYGLPTIVSKAVDTFGPFQFPGETVPAAVIAAIGGMQPDANDAAPREWIYVEDHVQALHAMLEKGTPGASYTVAGRGRMAPASIGARASQLVERHGPRRKETLRPDAAKAPVPSAGEARSNLDCARLEQDTGWRAEVTVEAALSSTVRWYLANEAWWRPLSAAQAAGHDFGILRIA